jgi:hypothetical protein
MNKIDNAFPSPFGKTSVSIYTVKGKPPMTRFLGSWSPNQPDRTLSFFGTRYSSKSTTEFTLVNLPPSLDSTVDTIIFHCLALHTKAAPLGLL